MALTYQHESTVESVIPGPPPTKMTEDLVVVRPAQAPDWTEKIYTSDGLEDSLMTKRQTSEQMHMDVATRTHRPTPSGENTIQRTEMTFRTFQNSPNKDASPFDPAHQPSLTRTASTHNASPYGYGTVPYSFPGTGGLTTLVPSPNAAMRTQSMATLYNQASYPSPSNPNYLHQSEQERQRYEQERRRYERERRR